VPTYRNTISNRCTATFLLLLATFATKKIHAQFDIEDSHTTASLRGVHNVGGGVAWASGTNGTVLRTEDGGYLWQTCSMPAGAEKLDFRGIQAFDENTAIVMSSGTGDQSRLYKTTDGCQTWKLLFTNPDKEGFWDALVATSDDEVIILGDSVKGKGKILVVRGFDDPEPEVLERVYVVAAEDGESSFAASNSVLIQANNEIVESGWDYRKWWASGTANHSFVTIDRAETNSKCEPCIEEFKKIEVPLSQKSASAGLFSLALGRKNVIVASGGDYKLPDQPTRTAAYSIDHGLTWKLAQTPPHGYRSSVAYDPTQKLWITVGPNGTDISRDEGKNWQPLKPSPQDPPDADKNWNALSLPFVVGPHGRIGRLRTIDQKPGHPK
jgi:photosystem II stability/assembly factor-like uncharacterized protein